MFEADPGSNEAVFCLATHLALAGYDELAEALEPTGLSNLTLWFDSSIEHESKIVHHINEKNGGSHRSRLQRQVGLRHTYIGALEQGEKNVESR